MYYSLINMQYMHCILFKISSPRPLYVVFFFFLFNVYVFDLCLCVCNMYCQCMIATIPLATGNKLNCFVSSRGMLTIIWYGALVLLICSCFLWVFYLLTFLRNHLPKKRYS